MRRLKTNSLQLGAITLCGVLFSAPLPTHAEDRLALRIEQAVKPKLESKDWVGLAVGVIEGKGKPPRVMTFGRIAIDQNERPTADTLFEIGSVTKVFTCIALAELVEEGKAKLDEPVVALLPSGTRIPTSEGREMTLENLATHTAALPRVPPIVLARSLAGKDPYFEVSEKNVFESVSNWKPQRPFGAKYSYSNLGTGLLGIALANRSGMGFPKLIESKILKPLSLNDTWFALTDEQTKRLARPYTKGGKPAKNWRFDALAGCGGLTSSANDMLRFLEANLDAEHVAKPLGPALLAAHAPRHDTSNKTTRVALGWHVTPSQQDRDEVIWHNGGTGGYRSFIGFQPKTRRAVVVLCNTDESVDALSFDILRFMDEAAAEPDADKSAKKKQKTQ